MWQHAVSVCLPRQELACVTAMRDHIQKTKKITTEERIRTLVTLRRVPGVHLGYLGTTGTPGPGCPLHDHQVRQGRWSSPACRCLPSLLV